MTSISSFNGQSLCVFCGSGRGNHPRYMALAQQTGQSIARHGYRLIYGGGVLGLMGATAKAAHASGGDVLGIIPKFLEEGAGDYTDIPHRACLHRPAGRHRYTRRSGRSHFMATARPT